MNAWEITDEQFLSGFSVFEKDEIDESLNIRLLQHERTTQFSNASRKRGKTIFYNSK